jgi:hypothetical protein
VHRDLKLENMVMLNHRDDSPVKIADFGLSKFFSSDNVLSTMCGSPQYVAPEVLGVGDGAKEYSPAVDMWSVGVILFILLSGYSPFGEECCACRGGGAVWGRVQQGGLGAALLGQGCASRCTVTNSRGWEQQGGTGLYLSRTSSVELPLAKASPPLDKPRVTRALPVRTTLPNPVAHAEGHVGCIAPRHLDRQVLSNTSQLIGA